MTYPLCRLNCLVWCRCGVASVSFVFDGCFIPEQHIRFSHLTRRGRTKTVAPPGLRDRLCSPATLGLTPFPPPQQVMEVVRAAEILSQAPLPPNSALPGSPSHGHPPKTTTIVMSKHTLAGAVSWCV